MVPSECDVLPGTVWQFEQAMGLESGGAVAPWFTCARCTPAMPVAEATTGGAAGTFPSAPATDTRAGSPWQEAQPDDASNVMEPSMWVARAAPVMLPVVAVSQV